MKFSNKAGCKVASQNDIALAARQKGLITSSKAYDGSGSVASQLLPTTFASPMHNFPSLSASIVFCSLGLAAFFSTWRRFARTAHHHRRSHRKESTYTSSRTKRSQSHSPRKSSKYHDTIIDTSSYGLFPESPRSKKSSSMKNRSKSTPNHRRIEDALSDGLCDSLNVFDKEPQQHYYYSQEKRSRKSPKKSTLGKMFS